MAVVVNFELSPFFDELFKSNDIKVYKIDFEDYKVPANFVWSLAFFKITALKFITLNTDYEYTLQLESDEICISNFDDMWRELDYKILMIYSPFRVDHPNRVLYSKLFHEIYKNNTKQTIVKTGAGFVAGRKDMLLDFVKVCDEIYDYIKYNESTVDKNIGDELYTSIYCALYPMRVGDAGPYATVYWTGSFYFAATNYKYDPVSIIHLPAEKKRGFIKLFEYYLKNKKLPKNETIYRIMNFPKTPTHLTIKKSLSKIKHKVLGLFKK